MTETNEDFYSAYDEVRHLTDLLTESDPEDNPYKSLYQARESLEKVLLPHSHSKSDTLIKICLTYQLAINHKLCNEISAAKEVLEKCLVMLEEYEKVQIVKSEKAGINVKVPEGKTHPIIKSTSLIKTHILQDLAIVLSSLSEPEKALTYLLSAKSLVDNDCNPKISYSIDEKLVRKTTNKILLDQRKKRIEAATVQTVFCLGQAYQQMNDKKNASKYIVNTLQLQYSNNQYSHKKWALDCAAISQFFMSENNFSQAALCLESAEYVISNAPKEEVEADSASFVEAKSDIARCWVKLILNFMEFTAILQIKSGILYHAKSLSISSEIDEELFSPKIRYTFFDIPLTFKVVPFDLTMLQTPLKATFQNSIKDMFTFAMSGIKYASKHFNIQNGFVIDSIELALDENMLWQYLACFEVNPEFQCRMVKKRFRAIGKFVIDPEEEPAALKRPAAAIQSTDVHSEENEDKENINPEKSAQKIPQETPTEKPKSTTKLNHKYYLDNVKQIWHTTSEIFADIMTLKRVTFQNLSEQLSSDFVNQDEDSHQNTKKLTKSDINNKLQNIKFSINKAGLRAIRAAHEFENCFKEGIFQNDSEKRAYLLTIMRKGRSFQTLIPNNNKEKLVFMEESRKAFMQVRRFEGHELLLREEECRLCEEFEKLLPRAADLVR